MTTASRQGYGRILLAVTFLCLAGLLLFIHARAVAQMRSDGLPAAAQLPVLERRQATLRAQRDAVTVQMSARKGAVGELIRAYVLPDAPDLDRLLRSLDVVTTAAQASGSMRDVSFELVDTSGGTTSMLPDSLSAVSVRLDAVVTQEGLVTMQTFLTSAGMLSVADLLSTEQIDALIRQTEHDRPIAIAALEQFLSTDLLAYAADEQLYLSRLMGALSSQELQDAVRRVMTDSSLQRAVSLLRSLRPALIRADAWPLRLLLVQEQKIEPLPDGMYRLHLRIVAPIRQQEAGNS